MTRQVVGPFQLTVESNTRRNGMYWPSGIEQLQSMCRESTAAGTWGYDTAGTGGFPALVVPRS